jgi:tripartite-type tricarboxylate transporter receptor subunit TctC
MLKAISVLALMAGAASLPARAADDYPAKPVRVIVGYLPGGPIDVVLRPLAQKLAESMGQPFVIENRPGANGNIGADIVAKSPPDGYTLLMATLAQLTNNPGLYPNMPFDTEKDLTPISLAATSPGAVVVHPSVPAMSLRELIALAKARPGKLNFSSTGNGSANHLAGELFKMLASVDMQHVPYKGGGPALNAAVGGEVEVIIISLPLSLPFMKAGRLRALALCAPKRAALWPQLPTTAEAGLPGLVSSSGPGMLAPAATPKPIIARIHAEITRALAAEKLRDQFTAQGLDVIGNTPEEFAAYVRSETARWSKVIKAASIKPD